MKRQLSFRFLAVMIVSMGILAVTGHLLHGHQVKRNAGYLLARSKQATADKDVPTTLRYLTHYLSLRPDDARTRARYGILLASIAESPRETEAAFLTLERALRDDQNLEQALRDDPEIAEELRSPDKEVLAVAKDLTQVRRKTANLAMSLELFGDAMVHIGKLIEQHPNDSELLLLLGRCEEDGGNLRKAIEAYGKARDADPRSVEAYSRLASVYRRVDGAEQADATIQALLLKNDTSALARVTAANYFLAHGSSAAARAQLEAAKKLSPDDLEVLLTTVQIANAEGKPTEAEEALRRGLSLHPSKSEFRIGLAAQELRAGRREKAIELLRNAAEKLSKPTGELWTIADLFIDANALPDAEKAIARMRTAKADAAALDYLEARIRLNQGAVREAEDRLLRCQKMLLKNSDLGLRTELLLANCYARLGKPDLQLKAARQAVSIDGLSVYARVILAAALLASGQPEEALEEYRRVMARDPKVRPLVVRLMIWQTLQKPSAEQSFEEAAKILSGAPGEFQQQADFVLAGAELLTTEGSILVARGRKLDETKDPSGPGKKLFADGNQKLSEAKNRIQGALEKDAKEVRYWLFLAHLAASQGKPADGIAVLERATVASGDGVPLRLARAGLLRRQQANPEAFGVLELGSERFSESERVQLFLGLAEDHIRAGSTAQAERLLRQARAIQPGALRVHVLLFDVVAPKGDAAEIAALVDPLREAEGDDGAVWRFASAYEHWLRYRKDNDPATLQTVRGLLTAAGVRRPNWFRVPLLEGEIADRVGQTDLALVKYKSAFQLGATQPEVVARLTYLLLGRNRHDEVDQLIGEYRRRTSQSTPELDRFKIINQLQHGSDLDDIAKLARVNETSDKVEDHLFRGRMFTSLRVRALESESQTRRAGKPAEAKEWTRKAGEWTKTAEDAFRKAVQVSPAAPEAWVSLVRFLAQTGKVDDAKKELDRAAVAVAADKKNQTLGPCYEAVGDREKARVHYEASGSDPAALQSVATFYLTGGELSKGVEVLRRLIAGSADSSTKRWARRKLALALASTSVGNYRQNIDAEGLINTNVGEFPGDLEDERILAIIKAIRPGARAESIKHLEALFLRSTAMPAEQFLLCRLYELDGDWPAANERYLGLLARPGGDDPFYIAHYARTLLRRKDAPAAEVWLTRLEQKDKDAPAVIELKARLRVLQGSKAEAATLLKNYAKEAYAKQKDPRILRGTGAVLSDLGLMDDAEVILRQYVAAVEMKTPAAVLDLAEFLAQHRSQVAAALEICLGALTKTKVDPEQVARVAVAVVRLGDQAATPAHFVEAERIIQLASAAKSQSVDIQVSLADLRDAQGRYDEAKAMYREILRREPRAILAMNNLAWLLALHEKKPDEALALLDEAVKIQGPEGNLLDTRGVIRLAAGDPGRAIQDLTQALIEERTPERHFHLAQAYHKSGKVREAALEMRKARELELAKTTRYLHKLEWAEYDALNKVLGD